MYRRRLGVVLARRCVLVLLSASDGATRSTSAGTRCSTAPSSSRSSRPITSTSITTRKKAEAAADRRADGGALARAALALLRARASRPAGRSSSMRSPAHFRQTNAVEGLIGEGTGGVTEALKRRVVLPMSGSLADTDHVLGHELVHAFQFDLTGDDPRETMAPAPDILQFPLWFVGGHGRVPVARARSMRRRRCGCATRRFARSCRTSATSTTPKYFPYRWGHAFWAYIGAKYGDRTVASLDAVGGQSALRSRRPRAAARHRPGHADRDWHAAISGHHARGRGRACSPVTSEARPRSTARRGGGRFNVGPRLSPDGKEIAFFSERDRFSVELFVADAETGRDQTQALADGHRSPFRQPRVPDVGGRLESGRQDAARLPRMRGGRPVLALIDPRVGPDLARDRAAGPRRRAASRVRAGRPVDGLERQPGRADRSLPAARSRPARSTGSRSDAFADLEPAFTPDGRAHRLRDRALQHGPRSTLEPGALRLARIDLATREAVTRDSRLSARQAPQPAAISADGRFVTFVADPDGVSNSTGCRSTAGRSCG